MKKTSIFIRWISIIFRLTKSRAKSLQATFCKPEIVDSLVLLSTHSYFELH